MHYGLDIGPGAIRVATDAGDGPTIDSITPVAVPVDEGSLEAAGLSGTGSTVRVDGTTHAVGAAARAVADADGAAANAEPESLFAAGVLATKTAVDAPAALDALLDDVLGDATDGRLCYTTPGSLADTAAPTDAHREAVESALADRGVDATPISKGFAVVYDQLAADNYTGLGICLESQTTSAALAYYGVPAMAVTIANGREWIVERAAGETGHAPAQVAGVLEEFVLDPDAAAGEIENALAGAYDALVAELIDAIRAEADETDVQQGLSVPIAIGGDGTIEGVEFLVGGRFDAAALPFSVRGVRLADDPAESAARGALAAARDDVEAYDAVTWSESAADSDETDGVPNTADVTAGAEGAQQTELTFDEAAASDAASDREDDAIDQLFDRLANRDDEVRSVRDDLEALSADLESVEERTAAADEVDELDERLESFGDDLTDLATESETHASDSAVASLDAEIERLDDELEALSDALTALADDIDDYDDALEDVESTAADERADLDDRIDDLAGDLEAVTDRTATIDEEIDEVRTDLEDFEATAATEAAVEEIASQLSDDVDDLEAGIERTGTRIDGVAGRLEELTTRLDDVSGRLERQSDRTDARFDAVETTIDEEIERLETMVRDLDETISTVTTQLNDLETRAAGAETVDGLAADLETVDGRIDDVRATLEEEIATLDDDIDSIAERIDDADAGANETAATGLEDDVSAIADRLESLQTDHDELVRAVESSPDESAVQALEEIRMLDSDIDSLDERMAAVAEQHASLEKRIETMGARIGEIESTGERDDDVEALRTELEAVRGEATATPALPSSIIAGGGGAGVVAGSVTALAGDAVIGVGAALIGLVLIGVAVGLAR
ncbi:chromosome segregation ATPase [Natrinema sp. DC36]|uniref:chromosome segregation ATPase n=1 Tax=Natrinema sp. DC36 TaxID=2878680 RepID=UPI001CF0A3AD|nr:chromosome segregation ATPase [Natrinema sp. DC36]